MSEYRDFSGPYFTVFNPNTGKYGPEKTLYLGTFHAVQGFYFPCLDDFRPKNSNQNFSKKKLFKAISSLYAGVSFYKELETYHASTGHKN